MNKPQNFIIRCAASGMYLCDVAAKAEVIAVTMKPDHAMTFAETKDAEVVAKNMSLLYPSFDWRVVHREDYTVKQVQPVFMHIRGLHAPQARA